MSKKKDAPPRPPAPKLTLNKLGSRQGSVGSISVHYSPLMDDNNSDLDEDVVFDPGTSSDQAPQQVSIKSKTWLVQQQQSRSAPSSEATTPVSTGPKLIGQSSLDQGLTRPNQDVAAFHEGSEKSLLSGLREKLNDLPNAFIGKIEEISNETVFADIVDRKIKKSDSMDSSTHNFGTLALSQTSVHIIDSKKTQTSTPSDIAIEEMITPTEALPVQNAHKRHDTSESLYSCPETELCENHHMSDAMSGGLSKSTVGSARERRFSPHKTSTDKTPMTLSGLLMNRDDSIEEISRSESENVFYDTTENLPDISSSKVTPKKNPSRSKYSWSILSVQQIVAVVVCILACLVIPLPSFISGLLSGVAMTISIIKLHQFVTQPSRPKEPFTVPDVDTLPPMRVPEMRESVNEVGKFKGWMNEVTRYDLSDYHINQTQSVFLHLEGANLRLQRATSRVAKRAMWTESQHSSIIFSPYQRFLKLTDANVSLLPKGIVRKRFWSKKYPILIELVASIQDPIPLDDLGDPMTSVEDLSSVKDSDPAVRRLYLFARTPREKEEWYWRFVAAAAGRPLPTKMAELLTKIETPKSQGSSVTSPDSPSGISRRRRVESNNSDSDTISLEMPLSEDYLPEYMKYMARIMPTRHGIPGAGKGPRLCEPNLVFLNAFIARFFWDFLREKYWAGKIRTKIQKKLSKIHVPYFIDELTVTGIEIGSEMPVIRRSTQPFLNDRGLWSDLDITYNGGFRMRLETKVNLMKLKKISSGSTITLETKETKYTKGSAVLNSDEEDSAESSTDDESMEEKPAETPDDKAGGSMKGKKLLRFVDKIAQSKYFQQVAEYKYIRKAMEEVSNTRLVLTVELKSLSGTLAINIPPPPTDRLWYGFRTNPRLWLSAKPRVGDRDVNVSHITDWIEKKLAVEFQRVFVMPNMDDLVIPLMCSHMPCDCCQSKAEDPTTAR